MKDLSLLNELELKIREMVSALEREKSRNLETKNSIQESSKLSKIEEKVKNLINLCPEYLTVHINGGERMIKELCDIKKETKLIGVTMLTSLNKNDLKDFGIICNEESYVQNLVNVAVKSGLDGVVSSSKEVKVLKKKYNNLIFVTPGIRLPNEKLNDQKRVDTPGRAIKNGSSILIIGRTINKSSNPIKSIQKIIKNIENELKNPN